MSRLKDIPALQRDGSNLSAVMQAVQEVMQTFRGYRGDPLDKALTLRDLTLAAQRGITGGGAIDAGIIGGTTPGAPAIDAYVVDPTPPPTPTGLAVSSGITSVFVSCDQPVYTQGHGHDITVVYGAKWPTDDPTQPTFSEAVELFRYQGTFSAYTSDPTTRWCIWIKWQSVDGVLSTDPAGGTNGVVTTTGQDVSLMVQAMTGPGNPFTVLTVDTVIDGVTFPAGTYSTKAFMQDLQVTHAKIGLLAVDNSNVANLSAAKLTVGDGTVGGNLKSSNYVAGSAGWLLQPNGTAEMQNSVVRGTVYATAGQIGGITVADNSIRAGQSAYNTGTGFHLGSDGRLSLGNSSGSRMTWDGSNLSIVGNGSFSGSLYGASITGAVGTFSGSLNVKSAVSGARVEMTDSVIRVYDANGVLRVKLGNLA